MWKEVKARPFACGIASCCHVDSGLRRNKGLRNNVNNRLADTAQLFVTVPAIHCDLSLSREASGLLNLPDFCFCSNMLTTSLLTLVGKHLER